MVSEVETNPSGISMMRRGSTGSSSKPMPSWTERIDPPSFLTRMDVDDVAAKAREEDLVLIRDKGVRWPAFLGSTTVKSTKLGRSPWRPRTANGPVSFHDRSGLPLARRKLGCDVRLQLFARVELTENHETYPRLGFAVTGPFTHPGFDRPTAYVFQRAL
jgi:hypothetical protein